MASFNSFLQQHLFKLLVCIQEKESVSIDIAFSRLKKFIKANDVAMLDVDVVGNELVITRGGIQTSIGVLDTSIV